MFEKTWSCKLLFCLPRKAVKIWIKIEHLKKTIRSRWGQQKSSKILKNPQKSSQFFSFFVPTWICDFLTFFGLFFSFLKKSPLTPRVPKILNVLDGGGGGTFCCCFLKMVIWTRRWWGGGDYRRRRKIRSIFGHFDFPVVMRLCRRKDNKGEVNAWLGIFTDGGARKG